jgi:hypothetical protein
MKYKYKIRTILWSLFVCILAFFFYHKIVPNGQISYFSDFSKKDYFISDITPADRIQAKKDNESLEIIGEPVYFTLHAPRKFKQAILNLNFQANNIEELQAGVLNDKTIWRYDLKPVYNRTIENLSNEWSAINENGLMLLEKDKNYKSLDQFLKNLPDKKEIAVYNYSLPNDYRVANYSATTTKITYPLILRGSYEFYVYIKNEPLDFYFDFATLNKNKDEDNIQINIYHGDDSIGSYQLKDDKISSDNGEVEGLNCFTLDKEQLAEGVYKIEVKANNDVITRKITTSQSKLSFINKIWIFGNINQVDLVTDSPYLSVETTNPSSLQEINFGTKKIKLNKTYSLVSEQGQIGIEKIKFSKNDILLAGHGVFALSSDELINPSFTDLSTVTDPEKQGIKFILAKYNPVKKIGDHLEAAVRFDLSGAYQENNKYSFILSSPGLNNTANNNNVELISAKMQLSGEHIGQLIKRYFYKFIKK